MIKLGKEGKKTGTASNPTVETQLASLQQELTDIKTERDGLRKEVKSLKRQLQEANTVIETDLRTGLIRRVREKSNFTLPELNALSIEQLQQIDATLSMGKGAGTFKNIRAGGAAVQGDQRFTVGNLYNPTRTPKGEGED